MSTLQHINSVVNYNWPEMSRRYPGFEKPQIVPAETLRGLAPVYLRSSIDQDPTSYFMFIAGDPTKGDCSREMACQFFDELFYEKLQMPSSYEANEGYTREEAIDKEVLPPATDRQFRSFYDEQMAKVNAEQERQRQIDNLGFDPDDGNTIDVDDDSSSDARAVGQAQSTAVGMPKKIFYCVDFHCPAGGTLGYDGGAGGRLGGGRGGRRFLREADGGNTIGRQLLDVINNSEIAKGGIFLAYPNRRRHAYAFTVDSFDGGVLTLTDVVYADKKIKDFLKELRNVGVKKISDITQIVTVDSDTVDGRWKCLKINPPNNMGNIFISMTKIDDNNDYRSEFSDLLRESDTPMSDILAAYKNLPEGLKKDMEQIALGDSAVVIKHKDGKFTVVEDGKAVMERVSADEVKKSGKLGKKQVTVLTKDEIGKMLSECDDADPETMMKEFVEKKRKCGVKEDEYRRPKNQPHNLHQVDEGEDIEEAEDVEEDEYRRPKNQPHNLHQVDEKDDGGEVEGESEELNESMVRFCDRLIRG